MTVSLALTSGKGGVGKSNCAVNLALSFSSQGHKTVLFDTDFGMANAHILIGANPKHTAAEFLRGNVPLSDILTEGPLGLRFIAGGSGLLELMNLDNQTRYRMLQSLSQLEDEIDYLIVDTPAGASDSTLFFASATDIPVIVLVAEPTSFLDAYALIKAAHVEKNINQFSVLLNMAEDPRSARQNFDKFFQICTRFLDINLHYAGMIPHSNAIRKSVVKRLPIMVSKPSSIEANAFRALSRELIKAPRNMQDGISFFSQDIMAPK